MLPPQSAATDPRDSFSVRDLIVLVFAGAALGVGFNALQLDANPARALAWVKGERTLAKLELEPPLPAAGLPVAAGASSPAAVTPAPGASPHAAAAPAAAATGRFVEKAPRTDPAAGSEAPAETDTRPGLSPPVRAPITPGAAGAPAGTPGASAAGGIVIPDSREPVEASLDIVRRLHADGAAVFLDARSAAEYAEGHIAGAVNVPFDEVFKHPELLKSVDAKGRPVITYCGGGDCELSRSLAFSLIDSGLRKVLVFTGGLPVWQAAGLAVRTGAQP
jgi:rhodanese-related sulfurtransferase